MAWARRAAKAWRDAHRAMDDFLAEAVRLSEEEFDRLCDAEFAKVDAMMAEMQPAIDEDISPRSCGAPKCTMWPR
jgi:hypothetical protein